MMSSSLSNSYPSLKPNIDEDEWVIAVRKSITTDPEDTSDIPVSIFAVPKVLLATDPESYIPQQVALGPFHHWHPEVYDMQRYKLSSARRTQRQLNFGFEQIVEEMHMMEPSIRASYHKMLEYNGETLAWMMAVDVAFLLEFLQVYSMREQGRRLKKITSGMSHLVDSSGKKLSHMAILRDLVKIENQIPLFLAKKMLEHQCRNTGKTADDTLKSMLMGLYHELSPFRGPEPPHVDVNDCDHLLDFLYHMTVPNDKELGKVVVVEETEIDMEQECITEVKDEEADSFANPSPLKRSGEYLWKVLSKSNAGVAKFAGKTISKPLTVVTKLPWKIISNLPVLKAVKSPVEQMLENLQGNGEEKSEDGSSSESKPLLAEEIAIPSVTEMAKAGIHFCPVKGGILEIRFDKTTQTLYLPVVDLDVTTQVYLRNLVAYEACVGNRPLVVARYTELMNGIIDTEEDAKILRERGIILNHLKSDKEVAEMWNGMSNCVKLTKVPEMDVAIEGVNEMYNNTWRVKLAKCMKAYVFGSWKFLTLLGALFLLLMTMVQAFCSVYTCARVFTSLPEFQGSTPAEH